MNGEAEGVAALARPAAAGAGSARASRDQAGVVVTAIAYPVIGRLADRFGPRRLILFGELAFGACVVALGFSTPNVALFYGLFAMIACLPPYRATMARWTSGAG